jgi:hypothetical protein
MKVLDAPKRPDYQRDEFARNSRIQDAIRRCAEAKRAGLKWPELERAGFTAAQQQYIRHMAGADLTPPELQLHYMKTIDATAQLLRQPMRTDIEFDTHAALDQPEMKEALAKWEYPRRAPGPAANPACAKALMINVANGIASHIRTARQIFQTQAGLQQVFAHHEREQAAVAGREAHPCTIRDYTSCLDHIEELSSTEFHRELLKANIEMLKSLRRMFPDGRVCELAAIDGTDVAAWCAQVGTRNFDEEQIIRLLTPRAGARSIRGGNEAVRDDEGQLVEVKGKGKFWRGYYLVVLVDVKTGLPIVWTLRDADWREADALKELLFLLYELWPDCPLEVVIGDKAWDFSNYARMCALNYGIHLVAIQKDSNAEKERLVDHKHISGYSGQGVVHCRKHAKPMTFVGTEGAGRDKRAGLEPGDDAVESRFNVRYRCDDCGSVRSIPMRGLPSENAVSEDWNTFTYYPHSTVGTAGMQKRFAERRALEARRNIAEATFSSLKTICQLALQGPRRTRLTNFDTVHTLIALSFTTRNALALAGERIRRGEYATNFPADVLDGREMRTQP